MMVDRMAKARPEYLRLCVDWKKNTTLGELESDQGILIEWPAEPKRASVFTTPAELMGMGRMPSFLTLDQVEFAFSTRDEIDCVVVPIWRHRLPNGRR